MRTTPPGLRVATVIGGWLLGATAATGVALLAVSTIGSGIANQEPQPLTSAEVARALSTAGPAATPATSGTVSAPPSKGPPSAEPKVLTTPGGSVVAQCSSGEVLLLSWTPAQGYEADDVRRGPGTHADLEFKSDGSELDVRVTCQGGSPVASTAHDSGKENG